MLMKRLKNMILLGVVLLSGCATKPVESVPNETIPAEDKSKDKVDYSSLDRKAPTIEMEDYVELENGQEISLNDFIKVTDDTSSVIYTCDGSVDTSVSGEYKVRVTATDKSGNISSKQTVFFVKEKEEVQRPVYRPQPQQTPVPEETWTEPAAPAPPPPPACVEYWDGGRYYSSCAGGSLFEWGDY